ncbi:MAG: 4Fe-4S dicluster domain-containing protein [Actinomycetota bacterium]
MSSKSAEAYINFNELDPDFKYEISKLPGGENIKYCFACGTCSAGCPVREIDEKYNPRRIIRMALLGIKDRVLSSDLIWLCSSCYTCHERCPQGVRITEVMNVLKNIAVREGYIHPSFIKQLELIAAHGRLYEMDEFDNKKRERMGLPPVATKCTEVSKIFEVTGILKVVSKSKSEE